jgi:hypothetical protein
VVRRLTVDTPFLPTRELFVLKLDDWPSLANRYLALNSAGRLAFLTGTGGQTYAVSVLTANPTAPIPAAATAPLLGAVAGAFRLAAG